MALLPQVCLTRAGGQHDGPLRRCMKGARREPRQGWWPHLLVETRRFQMVHVATATAGVEQQQLVGRAPLPSSLRGPDPPTSGEEAHKHKPPPPLGICCRRAAHAGAQPVVHGIALRRRCNHVAGSPRGQPGRLGGGRLGRPERCAAGAGHLPQQRGRAVRGHRPGGPLQSLARGRAPRPPARV